MLAEVIDILRNQTFLPHCQVPNNNNAVPL